MNIVRTFTLFVLVHSVLGNTTIVVRKNVLLSRRRRFLAFPKGINFIMTLSAIKPLLRDEPTGWTTLYECDIPFNLPTTDDIRKFRKQPHSIVKRSDHDRRKFIKKLRDSFIMFGFDDDACINRFSCEIQGFKYSKGKSLLKDLIYALFVYEKDRNFDDLSLVCNEEDFQKCQLPLVDYVLKSIL